MKELALIRPNSCLPRAFRFLVFLSLGWLHFKVAWDSTLRLAVLDFGDCLSPQTLRRPLILCIRSPQKVHCAEFGPVLTIL